MNSVFEAAKRIVTIANIGLAWAKDGYDHERYGELREIAINLLQASTDISSEKLSLYLPIRPDYPTPKVDVRAIVFNPEGKLLMVRERADGCWAPPGGWADTGYSPAQVAEKETQEEAGVSVKAKGLLGVVDKGGQGHPPAIYATYKVFVAADFIEGTLTPGHDVLDVAWQSRDSLPPLSLERITPIQLTNIFARYDNPSLPAFYN